jgi:predicted nucleotidyltransferase
MSRFQDRIKNTLARVDPRTSPAGEALAPFDKVLREFVETITAEQPFLGADIEQGYQPQMRMLVTWPRTRRDERTILLTLWWDGTGLKSLDEKNPQPFTSPDALGDYLLSFLENSFFPATLAEYKARYDDRLLDDKRAKLAAIATLFREKVPLGLLVLFGSHARGDWVDDPNTGYQSDFDLLAVVRDLKQADDLGLWRGLEARFREAAAPTPVTLIAHDLKFVNREIRMGQYFFGDICPNGSASGLAQPARRGASA